MKYLLLASFSALLFLGCKKEFVPRDSDYLHTAKQALKDSLNATDFAQLDFSKAVRLRVDSVGFYALRVPFKGKVPKEDFVFAKTNEAGRIEKGKIVHLAGTVSDESIGEAKRTRWDGNIELSSLDRQRVFRSPIVNGYVTAYHQQNSFRTVSQELQGDVMPEVIIVYTKTSSSSFSSSNLYMLTSMYANGGGSGGSGSNYYVSFSGGDGSIGNGGGGSGSSSAPEGGLSTDPVVLVDVERQDQNSPIDIEKFINCFNAIPDAGAACSIEIFADIPVDNDPNKIFNFGSNSPGHTFLNISKKNASQSVSQNIGFYPKAGWKTILTNAPMDSKFVNNSDHEFNCGFKINITPAQLKSALIEMQRSKNYKYDIDNYNCTDWALDVFNAAGGNLQIPLYDIPGNYPSTGTRMPNGVYNKLLEMKRANDPRAGGIEMEFAKGFSGTSTGPCN